MNLKADAPARPRIHRGPTFLLTAALIVVVVLVVASVTGRPTSATNCNVLRAEIIEMSSDKDVSIRSIENVEQYVRTDDDLVCRGVARWIGGVTEYSDIEFYWNRDDAGDAYIGYRAR